MARKKVVFLNASVVLAGLHSPSGGSAKILNWIKQGKLHGIISEIVVDEVSRHSKKIGLSKEDIDERIKDLNLKVCEAPKKLII